MRVYKILSEVISLKNLVSKELCIGCELCPSLAPELYRMDDDGKAVSIKEDISSEERVDAKEAADSCPTNAISVQ